MKLIKPVMQDDSFLTDVRAACRDERVLHIWWLGQSRFLLKWLDHCLLFDPYLSDSLTTKYAATDKPHTRMTERVVGPGRLDFINAVTSSHNHTDHLDAETLGPLLAVNPRIQLVIPAAKSFTPVQTCNSCPLQIKKPVWGNNGRNSSRLGGLPMAGPMSTAVRVPCLRAFWNRSTAPCRRRPGMIE